MHKLVNKVQPSDGDSRVSLDIKRQWKKNNFESSIISYIFFAKAGKSLTMEQQGRRKVWGRIADEVNYPLKTSKCCLIVT